METIFRITLTTVLVVGAVSTIAMIGRPRKPIDHSTAIISTVINAALILGLWWLL